MNIRVQLEVDKEDWWKKGEILGKIGRVLELP